jgi:ATP-binding cassette subfamily B protein
MKQRLDRSLFSLIIHQFIQYWYYYLGAIFCLFATHTIQSKLPFWASELAELVSTGDQIDVGKFFWLAIGIIIFRTGSRLLFFYPARVLQKELRVELLERLEKAHPSRYLNHSDGQVFQVLMMDMDQLRALIGFALLQVGNVIVALTVLLPKLASFNQNLLYALLPLLISFILFSLIVGNNHKIFREVQDTQGEVQNVLIESYAGKKTIKNFHSESAFINLFKQYSWKELMLFYRAGIGIGFSIPLIPLGFGASLLWGAYLVRMQDLGPSALILFSGFIFLLLEPMQFVSWIGIVFARSFSSWQRIKELVSDISTKTLEEESLEQRSFHWHQDHHFTLELWKKDISLKIEKGSWSILVAKTGHGKSYLLNQVANLLKANGEEISLVTQSPYLYNDTLEKNIFLGKEASENDRELAYQLLKVFGLDYLASSKEKLFDLEVGENGRLLSGGQAKRVCLIRSILSDANVLLWDDPFSSVDLILEKNIITELKNLELLKSKTIIMSGHRMSTVRYCDKVIYFSEDEGVIEQGQVQSLLIKGTKVYDYFEYQMV